MALRKTPSATRSSAVQCRRKLQAEVAYITIFAEALAKVRARMATAAMKRAIVVQRVCVIVLE